MITGPSGVGKGTLISNLLERVPGLELSVSATTRAPRPGEEEGRDYYFLSEEDFQRRVDAGDFIEHAAYAGNRYGTLRSELDRPAKALVLEIDTQGARQVRQTLPEAMQVFIAPPSPDELRARLIRRGSDDPDQIERRLRLAVEELNAQDEFARVVVNDDLQRAVQELVDLAATISST